jgi:hypothetical protein
MIFPQDYLLGFCTIKSDHYGICRSLGQSQPIIEPHLSPTSVTSDCTQLIMKVRLKAGDSANHHMYLYPRQMAK